MKGSDGIEQTAFLRSGKPLQIGPEPEVGDLDRKIIRLLQLDGRMSFVDLADAVGATQKTVRKRVANLRTSRVIEITTVADPHVVGYRSMALAGIRSDSAQPRSQVAKALFELESVDYAVVTTGRYDILIELLHRSDAELSEALDNHIRPHPGVRDVEVFPFLKLHYQQPVWESAQERKNSREKLPEPPEIDEIDAQIIRGLNQDGRASFSDLAIHIGVSESQIRKRYSRLTSSGVLRVLALTNPRSIGFNVTAWLAIRGAQGKSLRSLADDVLALPSIAYLAICSGRFDIFAEVVCRDTADLLQIVDHDVRGMDGVGHVESFLCQQLLYRPVSPIL